MKYRWIFFAALFCVTLSFFKCNEGIQSKNKSKKRRAIPVSTTEPLTPIKKAELDSDIILSEAIDAEKLAKDAFDTASSVRLKSKSDMDNLMDVIYTNVATVRKNTSILSNYQKQFNKSYAYIKKGNIKSTIINDNYKDMNNLQYNINYISSQSSKFMNFKTK